MDNFIVSARKYRPNTFEDVLGQDSITNTLSNAIKNNLLAQAFLFCGPRGVGKTTCARIFAKEINSFHEEEKIKDFSFNIFELDAASNNSVDDIRSLTDQVRIPPQTGKFKVYIIDEAHMLSQAAFNSFLKTLEEPPAHAIFILATTEKHKIIPTILSRCQIFDFKRIEIKDIIKKLKEISEEQMIICEEEALHVIAQKADGALRDALSIFDQIVSFCGKEITYKKVIENLNIIDFEYFFEITNNIIQRNTSECLNILNDILNNGFNAHNFITKLTEHFRNLLISKDNETINLLNESVNIKKKIKTQSDLINPNDLLKAMELCNKADLDYKKSSHPRLLIEMTLIQLCNINNTIIHSEKEEKKNIILKNDSKNQNNDQIIYLKKASEEKIVKKNIILNTNKTSTKRTISINLDEVTTLPNKDEDLDSPEKSETQFSEKKFSQSDLEASWKNYATKISLEGKHNLSSILKEKIPYLHENFKVKVQLINNVQKELLELEKQSLLKFLKEKLYNDKITLEIEINFKKEIEAKAYTEEDKFEQMSQKNSSLINFKNKLDLEIDY
mgnify:CR=1 FL=1